MTSEQKKTKKTLHFISGAFYPNQSTSNTILAQISPNLLEKNKKNDLQRKRQILIAG